MYGRTWSGQVTRQVTRYCQFVTVRIMVHETRQIPKSARCSTFPLPSFLVCSLYTYSQGVAPCPSAHKLNTPISPHTWTFGTAMPPPLRGGGTHHTRVLVDDDPLAVGTAALLEDRLARLARAVRAMSGAQTHLVSRTAVVRQVIPCGGQVRSGQVTTARLGSGRLGSTRLGSARPGTGYRRPLSYGPALCN